MARAVLPFFPRLLVSRVTGAVVPSGHPVRVGLGQVAQMLSAKPGHPGHELLLACPPQVPAAAARPSRGAWF